MATDTSRQIKVLVVDDAAFIRALYKQMFKGDRFKVFEASRGQAGVERYKEERPDIVFLDLLMPGTDGFHTLQEILEHDAEANVVICSADIQASSMERALEIGARDFLNKPFTREMVLGTVAKVLGDQMKPQMPEVELTTIEKDALIEIVHIGIGKAAASLSQLINKRVELSIPDLEILRLEEIENHYSESIAGETAGISQRFFGPFSGDALLLFPQESSVKLINLLLDRGESEEPLSATEKSALIEVGNILISACLGTFGNMLNAEVGFTNPRLKMEGTRQIFSDLFKEQTDLHYGLVLRTEFTVRRNQISGFLVLVFGFPSLDFLKKAIERILN